MARKSLMWILLVGLVGASILAASCGGEGSTGGSPEDSEGQQPSAMSETTMKKMEDTAEETTPAGGTESGEAAELARAKIGSREITNMLPADGKKPRRAAPCPRTRRRERDLPRDDQPHRRGPYRVREEAADQRESRPPVAELRSLPEAHKDRHAVHSMDHGVVWITHRTRPAGTADRPTASLRQRRIRHSQPVPGPGRAGNRHLMEGPAGTRRCRRPTPEQFVDEFRSPKWRPSPATAANRRRQPQRVKSSGLAGRRRKPYPDTCNVTSRSSLGGSRTAPTPYRWPEPCPDT